MPWQTPRRWKIWPPQKVPPGAPAVLVLLVLAPAPVPPVSEVGPVAPMPQV